MRLLNVQTLKLENFFGTLPPRYAILSHTWGEDEVLYTDIQDPAAPFPSTKFGASKVKESCKQAKQHGFGYIWIDTCCIDKASSAELSESINSMFAWYRQADICFAYLADIDTLDATLKVPVEKSRWFTRGWTLQELIAPRQVIFYNNRWIEIGRREPDPIRTDSSGFLEILVKATGIPSSLLCRNGDGPCALGSPDLPSAAWELYLLLFKVEVKEHDMRLYNGICQGCNRSDRFPSFLQEAFSNAQKMSWAAGRVTTRREDQAYCLLGLFGVHMPLLYGEGDLAFMRLQEEIMRKSDDPSLLAFDCFKVAAPPISVGLLAPSARYFADSPIRLPRSSRMYNMNRITVDSKLIGLRLLMCPDDGRSKWRFWLGILPSRCAHDLAARPALLLQSPSDDDINFSRVFYKEIILRPVATEVYLPSLYEDDLPSDVAFDLSKAKMKDIRISRKAYTASRIQSPQESPAIRIFLPKDITLLRIYPGDLGHEMVQRGPQLPGVVGTNFTDRRDDSVIYIPAHEGGPVTRCGAQDYITAALCLQSEGETRPFYVLFYGYRQVFPAMRDPFKGVSGRAVVQVDMKPENGDPTSPQAMEAALLMEARMQKGNPYSPEGRKRASVRCVNFLDQILLELVVEVGAEDTKMNE